MDENGLQIKETKMKKILVILLLLATTTGCATYFNIAEKNDPIKTPTYYGGARFDLEIILALFYAPYSIIYTPYALIDLPLSLVGDTLTIPIVYVIKSEPKPEPTDQEYQEALKDSPPTEINSLKPEPIDQEYRELFDGIERSRKKKKSSPNKKGNFSPTEINSLDLLKEEYLWTKQEIKTLQAKINKMEKEKLDCTKEKEKLLKYQDRLKTLAIQLKSSR